MGGAPVLGGPSHTGMRSLVCDLYQQYPHAYRAQPCHEARDTPPAFFFTPHESQRAVSC